VSLRLGKPFHRSATEPLAYMTQRCRLDAYLAEQAVAAGAEFRDGVAVREIELSERGVLVRANGDVYPARALVGADGANGAVGRATGLAPTEAAVALEGNIAFENRSMERWERAIALDLGGTPGGYGWLFPKGDHVNVGVGGWRRIGPSLRARLSKLCGALGLDEARLTGLRGYHLPMRAPGAPIVRGPALLAGDAAGLVDPLSGEGIEHAFASGRLAADAVGEYLSGRVEDLSGYQRAVEREIEADLRVSIKLQAIFQRWPRPCVAVMRRSDRFWTGLCGLVRGELGYAEFRRRLGPLRWLLDGAALPGPPR
jgi:flavin-dependent dehydrogenase